MAFPWVRLFLSKFWASSWTYLAPITVYSYEPAVLENKDFKNVTSIPPKYDGSRVTFLVPCPVNSELASVPARDRCEKREEKELKRIKYF